MPGGPISSTPFGIFAPRLTKRSGTFRNSTTSCSSSFASSTPATSSKLTAGLLPTNMRARLLPKLKSLVAVALSLPHHKQQNRAEEDKRQEVDQDAEQAAEPAGPLDVHPYRRGRGINTGGDEHLMHARGPLPFREV